MDWVSWHAAYDDPSSTLSMRLRCVRSHLSDVRAVLVESGGRNVVLARRTAAGHGQSGSRSLGPTQAW
jgi:hypothetical protein